MTTGWFSGPGIGVLNGIFLRLDCTNDPLTAGLEINAATAGEPVLTLLTTDDDPTNPYLDLTNSGTPMPYIVRKDGARFLHTYGTDNLFLGVGAGNFTLTGSENTGLGAGCLPLLTTGATNVALGWNALGNLTTGFGNMAVGPSAGATLGTGFSNSMIGDQAGFMLGAGQNNVAIGSSALRAGTNCARNMAIGNSALRNATSGSEHVALGVVALFSVITNHRNVGIGYGAGYFTTGGENIYIGYYSGFNQQTGQRNVFIGHEAGRGAALYSASNSVFIGYQAGYNETTSNKLYIANTNTATPLIYGEFDTWRLAFGNQYAVDKYGQLTHASGQFAAVGDAQDSRFVCRLAQASHAVNTWYALYPDGGTTPERLTIAADTGWAVRALVVGITQNSAQQWMYEIVGLLERDNANNTTLAVQTVTTHFESDANYDAQLVADDANEALEVQVRRTGGVDYDVHWVCSLTLAEVSYA